MYLNELTFHSPYPFTIENTSHSSRCEAYTIFFIFLSFYMYDYLFSGSINEEIYTYEYYM